MKITELLNESQPGVAEGLSKQFEIMYRDRSGERHRKIVIGTSKEAVARQFRKQYNLEIEQIKELRQGVAEGSINEFAPGEGGFGPFKVYVEDHFVDKFGSFDEAWEEIEFLRSADPKSYNHLWKIVDGTGKTVWEHDPGETYDQMRKSQKFQFRGPDSQGVAEEQLAELSPQTLASYKRKAGAQASELDKRAFHKDTDSKQAKRDIAKANKRFSGIVRATKKEFDK